MVYDRLARFRDLWIVLAWGIFLGAIFLNTYYNRNCFAFVADSYASATCQGQTDLLLIFIAALGAGLSIESQTTAALGFLFAHIIATAVFVVVVILPPLTGATGPLLLDSFLTNAIILGFLSSFPVALFVSLVGCLLGLYVGGKLPTRRIRGSQTEEEWTDT